MDQFNSIPLPTIERPFGTELWPLFVKGYSSVMGYSPTDFNFIPGQTRMSTLTETASVLVVYYVIIFDGREFMKDRPAYKNGVFFAICDHEGGWTKELVTLYYLNYITKYIEWIDTVFLFFKKKPLTFLHTYHHGATALLCYIQLVGLTSVSWVPITLNLMVHVVMYWYYFQSTRGVRIWWKESITRLQILQFVIDLGFVHFVSYTYFTSTYLPYMPNMGKCAGEEFAAVAGICFISSYLLLFISFYFATYKKTAKTGRPGRNTGRETVIAMAHKEVSSPAGAASPSKSRRKEHGDAVAPGRSPNGQYDRARLG
ncbi:hypothetical protein MMC13_001904 [Lambiella insularis]|nr:hypothetical protein [Lambiella insularis]